jgi:hypothetical protein
LHGLIWFLSNANSGVRNTADEERSKGEAHSEYRQVTSKVQPTPIKPVGVMPFESWVHGVPLFIDVHDRLEFLEGQEFNEQYVNTPIQKEK